MKHNYWKALYLEENYENLKVLSTTEGKEPSVFLVRNKQTGVIAVKKYVNKALLPVYESLAGIEDSYIEKIYEFAETEKYGLVIAEYISGNTLQEYMKQNGVFAKEEACRLIEELLYALSKVHKQGIIHRDINPNNIMISNDGVLKLIDFGIARQKKEFQGKDTTILGTVGYAAPEQFGFLQTDERTDIYAVGVLWNQMLTGCFPNEKCYAFSPVKEMIQHCTEIDIRQRYRNVEEILTELGNAGLGNLFFAPLKEKKKGLSIRWLPGFRSGVIWKNVVAIIGYFLMFVYSAASIYECAGSVQTCFLEIIAIFIYVWGATLLVFNIYSWDKRGFFGRMPRPIMITIRVLLWMCLFYFGVLLENYVRFDLVGIARK